MNPVLFPRTEEMLLTMVKDFPEARFMAGGTDLLVALRQKEKALPPLIGLEHMEVMGEIQKKGEEISIGAACTLKEVASHPLTRQHLPLLCQGADSVGGPALRNMATLGGNLCTASPAGETLPALFLLEARLDLLSETGLRTLSMEAFITGPGRTALLPGELLHRIRIPIPQNAPIQHFEKVGNRNAMAIAVASLAALIRMEQGLVAEARLAWGSVGPKVIRSSEAEAALMGKPLREESLKEAAFYAQKAVQPISDIRASADYRKKVSASLLQRLILYRDSDCGGKRS